VWAPLPDALEDFAGVDVLLQRLERAATGLRHLGVDEEQRDPMAAKMKNTPLIWIASTSAGKNSARNPFVVHPKNTATPIPRPRMCSGKTSASDTHTATLRMDRIRRLRLTVS
jgi:hypothetical protein